MQKKLYYSGGNKFVVFCFALLLPQILVNFQNQGQIWNLLVLTFSKHPLHVQFDQVLAEIFEVKDTWGHSFIFLIIDLVSLTSNISTKTWSRWTCRGCFEIIRTSRFQNWPWFWKLSKICGSNRAKQNTTDFSARLYNDLFRIYIKSD